MSGVQDIQAMAEFTPLPGPVFLELNPGEFLNLAEVLSLFVTDTGLSVLFRNTQVLGWYKDYALDAPARERVLRALRSWEQPTMIAPAPDPRKRWGKP